MLGQNHVILAVGEPTILIHILMVSLMFAAVEVTELLNQNLDPNRGDYAGKTPLHIAS